MRRLGAATASVVLVAGLAACAPSGERAVERLDDVMQQRDAAILEVHDDTIGRVAGFLRNTWGPVTLPDESIVALVTASEWGPAMARCIGQLGFPGVQPADGGERLDFSGVTVSGPRENYEIDVATYRCYARFPVRTRIDERVNAVEAPWAYRVVVETQLPCIAADGHAVPPVPTAQQYADLWRTDDAFDAFAAITDPAARARASERCPDPLRMLEAAISAPAGSEAVAP